MMYLPISQIYLLLRLQFLSLYEGLGEIIPFHGDVDLANRDLVATGGV